MRHILRLGLAFIVLNILSYSINVPQTTIVVLNWSRLPNVRKIASEFCKTLLEDTVHEIIVWNNHPNKISYGSFPNTTCPKHKLRIINSPTNLYFQARFMACSEATTSFCFLQDDDYLVRPPLVRALTQRMTSQHLLPSIHLQPPEEMLTSELRTIDASNKVHMTFAWLGYGTIIRRSLASDFLSLLNNLTLSEDDHKMADNYFSILGNRVPERWFDPGIPLGGGEPFTVGSEGEERNNRHILRASAFLNYVVSSNQQWPYMSPYHPRANSIATSACLTRDCLFETSIDLIPRSLFIDHQAIDAREILSIEKIRRAALGVEGANHYLSFHPSNAVDGDPQTAFCSRNGLREGDWISLQFPRPPTEVVKLTLLVDRDTVAIIVKSKIALSIIDGSWVPSDLAVSCDMVESNDFGQYHCSLSLTLSVIGVRLLTTQVHVQNICIYEISI